MVYALKNLKYNYDKTSKYCFVCSGFTYMHSFKKNRINWYSY